MKPVFVTFVVLAFALVLFGCTQATPTPAPTSTPTLESTVPPTTMPTASATATASGSSRAIGMSEVAAHAVQGDCWLVIDGKVYDLSGFEEVHPGDGAFLKYCGLDASVGFHTKDGRGRDHSAEAKAMMADYQIGVLAA